MKLKDIRQGQLFYESESGMNIEAVAMEDAHIVGELNGKNKFGLRARNTQTGEEIQYMMTEGFSAYGPRIYTSPMYIHGQTLTYPLHGGDKFNPEDPLQMVFRRKENISAWAGADTDTPLAEWVLATRVASLQESLDTRYEQDELKDLLDGLVHDLHGEKSNEILKASGDTDRETVIDHLSTAAADICNDGAEAQLRYLVEQNMSDVQIVNMLNERAETPTPQM